MKRIEVPVEELANWRHYVKIGARNARSSFLLVNCPGYPHPLQFELGRGTLPSDGLRQLAPEAVGDFERDNGLRAGSAA
jgi:hypothetical protein